MFEHSLNFLVSNTFRPPPHPYTLTVPLNGEGLGPLLGKYNPVATRASINHCTMLILCRTANFGVWVDG